MLNIFTKLKTQDHFSHSEQLIVDYILAHPLEVLEMNTKQLCEKCFVSTATIYRLCEKLGLSGFSDLKVKMSNSLHNYQKEDEQFDFDFPVKEYQTHYEIIGKIKEDYEKTLVSTANLFDLEQMRLIVQAMVKAKEIDIYTSAGNIYFAQNFKFQMQEIGRSIHVPVDDYMQKLTAATSDDSHLAIVISFEGRGVSVNSLLKILKKVKTPILLISSSHMETIVEPDYQLYISGYENHYKKISSFSTRLSILYILDVLYTCYFELDYKNNIEKKVSYYSLMTSK
ncbi:MAG: MurR/RpiR family transcriptional regulator [Faecalibacillus sp.]